MNHSTNHQKTTLWVNKLLILLFLHLLLMFFATALHAATYTYRNDIFSYDAPSASATRLTWHAGTDGTWLGSPGCTTYPNGDDDWADIAFTGGFTFTFNGVVYSQVRVYSNGILAFGTDTSGYHRNFNNLVLPITTAASTGTGCSSGVPNNLMVAYWTDIVAGTANATTAASVQYEMLGTAPSRRLVISWVNVKLYNQTARYNFQIVLYESAGGLNSNFEYQYTTGSSTGAAATVGVQLNATDYTQYSYNQAFIDPVVGTTILWYPSNQLFAKAAEYRFDEGVWAGVAGEIKDTSGSGNNGLRVGAAVSFNPGKLCRGGSFSNNTSNTTIDAVATPVTPANKGSVDFWYKSTNAWNSADTLLFDATTVAARPFFLMKRSTGKLRFVITDSAGTVSAAETSSTYTYAANTWHHIAVSWNFQPGTNQTVQQIFLDGVMVNTTTTTPFRSTTSGTIAALSTLYIGDNRTANITPSTGTANGANGIIDEVYIYAIDINANQAAADMALTRPTCTTFDHFHIVHNGTQLSCNGSAANISIEAHDPTHALITLSGATMSMSTSTNHGTWSGVSAINPVINTTPGNGTYTFSNESSVVLGLANPNPETLNINLASGTISEHSGAAASCVVSDYTLATICDADLEFIPTGFRFVDSAGNNIGNQIAGTTSATYYLQAVKNTCVTPGVCSGICSSVFPAGTAVNIGLGFECSNPTACAGQQITLAASGTANPGLGLIAANANGTISTTTGTYSTQNVTFNAALPTPAVPFTLNYPDVGQIKLWARYPAVAATMSGTSAAFVVKPHHFAVSGVTQTAAPQLLNPAAATAFDAKFVKAGEPFSATITAMTSTNIPTPNFGKEIINEGVKLTHNLILPSGGAAGTLSNATILGTGFTNGVATITNLAWSEVGIITLMPSIADADYLGTGNVSGTTSANIGRFIPDHFGLTQGTATPSCGVFTYFGQDGFTSTGFTLTAQNLANATTQNYTGSFAKLGLTLWSNFGFSTSSALPTGSILSASTTAPSGSWLNGIASVSAKHQISRPTALTAETFVTVNAAPIDSDGVTVAAKPVAPNTPLRYGRMFLGNVYGSELLGLAMPASVQYWNGSAWIKNSDDNCTTAVNLLLTDPNNADGLIPAELCAWDTGSPGGSGLGCSIAGSLAKQFKTPPVNGDFNLNFKATGLGNTGMLDVTAIVPNYLKFNWRSAGNANPIARATFGVYKGNSKQIYFRELY